MSSGLSRSSPFASGTARPDDAAGPPAAGRHPLDVGTRPQAVDAPEGPERELVPTLRTDRDRVDPGVDVGLDAALDEAASAVLARTIPAGGVILLDGRSGSGKTTLAARIAAGLPLTLVGLDDLYPGWDGLDAGVDEVLSRILAPRRSGEPAVWRRWDWSTEGWAESHTVPGDRPLLVEGSGVLTSATAALADLTVWLDAPADARRHRALVRDGDLYRPHWDRWAAQEERHLARDRPRELADLVVALP